MEKLVKVVYDYHDRENYSYFLTEPDGIDTVNCTQIVETMPNWIKAIDGDKIYEQTNLHQKVWRKIKDND